MHKKEKYTGSIPRVALLSLQITTVKREDVFDRYIFCKQRNISGTEVDYF